MPQDPYLQNLTDGNLDSILERMAAFEASGSLANTGTGTRREGEKFEILLSEMWAAFSLICAKNGAESERVPGAIKRQYVKHVLGGRELYIPCESAAQRHPRDAKPTRWLEVSFSVEELVASYPSVAEAIARYSPDVGDFRGGSYPNQYSGLSTKFDDTVVLVKDGALHEKILLEYKTAKSTKGTQLDGNAHERLAFQMMQYLEAATRYTRCSFTVIANGAFALYRNKYHVNFQVQADRLRNFAWFSMDHACTLSEYRRFLNGLLQWLFQGKPREN